MRTIAPEEHYRTPDLAQRSGGSLAPAREEALPDDVMRAPEPAATRSTRVVWWLAFPCIGGSILIMVAAAVIRSGWMYPPVAMPAVGPPWAVQSVHISPGVAVAALWVATAMGAAGVVAGLLAVRRGTMFSIRPLLITAALAVAVLTVMLPAGSTDAFDYASYGRIVTLGHSPYVMTPFDLRQMHDAFSVSVPVTWQHSTSIYGPLATGVNYLAARLGGSSVARTVFWLKLWYAIAFGIVAFVMDRLLRRDPARRLRAHLLWTINPLLLWDLVAATHVDALAAGLGMLGILALGEHSVSARPSALRVLTAGALIGAAAEIKINYALFGLGLAWALRRSPLALAQAAVGALAVLLPGYLWFGPPAVQALAERRNIASGDNFYRFFVVEPEWRRHLAAIAVVLAVGMAILVLRRLPEGAPTRPAIRPTIALSAAWLSIWPYQLPWYEAMIICLLVLYPASRLDWLVIAMITAGTLPNIPAPGGQVNTAVHQFFMVSLAPLVLLAAAIGLAALCVTGRWKPREPGRPPGAALRLPECQHGPAHSLCELAHVRRNVSRVWLEDSLGQRVHGGIQLPVGGRQPAEQPVPERQRGPGEYEAFHQASSRLAAGHFLRCHFLRVRSTLLFSH